MLTSGTIAAIILIPAGGLITLVALVILIAGMRHEPNGFGYDDFRLNAGFGGGTALVVGLLLLVFPLIGLSLVGFNGDYMAYKPISGQVQDIASRQIADGKGMSTRYVVQINGAPYGVDDTRAALVKKGDTVNLNCVKEFVWGSTNNGYACNWG